MYVKSLIVAFVVGASVFAAAYASAEPAPAGMLSLDADYAAFRIQGDTSNAYVEIYYSLHRNQLKYHPAENGYVSLVDFKLLLSDEAGKLLDTLSWRAGSRVSKLSELESSDFLITDMVGEKIPHGRYTVDLYVTNEAQTGHSNFVMNVPSFGNALSLSTIELAYKIEPDSVGKFVKSGDTVLPNPSRQFLQDNNVIYLYAEGYGLDTTSTADTGYTVALSILSPDGQPVKTIPPFTHRKPGESAVIRTGFSIAALKPGEYNLKVSLADGPDTVFTARDFSVLASRTMMRQAYQQSVLNDFPEANRITSEEDADKFRNEIIYIAAPDELKFYDSLNLTGKAGFQRDFWASRNPEPSSSINQYEIEHYRRFKYANSVFSRFQGNLPGWKTDRGRVYVLYGEPSDIERYPSSLEARAWERWWYTGLEGGVYFIFVDIQDTGDYQLVHSSKQNEIQDYNWQEKVVVKAFQR